MWTTFLNIINYFSVNNLRGLCYTIFGTIFGYIPAAALQITNQPTTNLDTWFQRIVWGVTILVAIFAIIAGIQRQIDRFKKHKNI